MDAYQFIAAALLVIPGLIVIGIFYAIFEPMFGAGALILAIVLGGGLGFFIAGPLFLFSLLGIGALLGMIIGGFGESG